MGWVRCSWDSLGNARARVCFDFFELDVEWRVCECVCLVFTRHANSQPSCLTESLIKIRTYLLKCLQNSNDRASFCVVNIHPLVWKRCIRHIFYIGIKDATTKFCSLSWMHRFLSLLWGVCGLLAVAGGLWPAVCGLFADKHGSGDCLPLSLTGCWKPWGQGNRCFDRSRASWPHPAGGGDLRLFASANAGHNICVTRHPPRF